MNNTTTRTLALVAFFMAATLVVGTFATTTTAQTTAFAYSQKKGADKRDGKDGRNGNDNGNTIAIQKCKQAATQSGFDNTQQQECENLICTYPGENATCTQEGAVAVQQGNQTTPVKLTCEQCFTKFLTSTQISALLRELVVTSFTDLCPRLSEISISILQSVLRDIEGVSESTKAQLIQCLLDAGVQFSTGTG